MTSEIRPPFRQLLAFDVSLEKEARDVLLFFQTTSLYLFKQTLYVFPVPLPPAVKNKIPKQVNYIEHTSHADRTGSQLFNGIDLIIGPLNEITREAARREFPVWLYQDKDAELDLGKMKKYFPTVTTFQIKDSLADLFRAMSLLRLFEPHMLVVSPGVMSARAILLDDFKVDIPAMVLASPMDILALYDNPFNYPQSLSIETTTYCNLRCSYCPNSTIGRPVELMDEGMFYRIIDSLAEYLPDYKGSISPHFYGEPLTDNRLERFVEYIHEKLPAASIIIYTNGVLLTKNRYLDLTEAGVSQFIISQHTEAPDAKLIEILEEIRHYTPEIHSVKYVNQYHEPLKFNRGGLVDVTTTYDNPWDRDGCMAFKDMIFDVHGNAVLCCNDYRSKHTFGNIEAHSLRDIWQNPAYIRARWEMLLGFNSNPLCRICKNMA